jgi:hypothetical protein
MGAGNADLFALQSELDYVKPQQAETSAKLLQLESDTKQKLHALAQPRASAPDEAGCKHRQQQHAQRPRLSHPDENSLSNNEVLDIVFSFVGRGDYYYIAGVCRNWRGRYMKLCHASAEKSKHMTKRKLRTSCHSFLETAARLQLALDNGLTIAKLNDAATSTADAIVYSSLEPIAVLSLARVHGLVWQDALTEAAASAQHYELLEWLFKCGCSWDEETVIDDAYYTNDFEHLKRLRAITGPWCGGPLEEMLLRAASNNQLEQTIWFREECDIDWPASFYDHRFFEQCWSLRCVQWALANGCTWGEWRCQHLDVKYYGYNCDDGKHTNGPCKGNDCSKGMLLSCLHGHIRMAVLAHAILMQQQQQQNYKAISYLIASVA